MTPKYPPTYREVNPNTDHALIHNLLVGAQQIEYLPRPIIGLLIGLAAALVGLAWFPQTDTLTGLGMGGLALAAALIAWAITGLLPVKGRSFGPVYPSMLTLSLLIAGLLIALGLLAAPPALGIVLTLTLLALAAYATWIEPFRLGVTVEHKRVPGWQGDPLRLLHIGDLHLERITQREQMLNTLITAYRPDVIAFSGDLVNLSYNADPVAFGQIRQIVGLWQAQHGVFLVSGTPAVEPLETVREILAGLPVDLVENAWRCIDYGGNRLALAGMITTHDMVTDRAALAHLASVKPEATAHVLLVHTPDVIPEAAQSGFDLYLCGHTHGGQIRLPLIGAVFTASALGRQYAMGRHETGDLSSYTVRGVGMEGLGAPRARLLCPPEIVLWEIGGE